MMGEVVQLARHEPRIWVCGCGCRNFELREDGMTECCLCGAIDTRGHWRPQAMIEAEGEGPDSTRTVTYHGAADLAKAAIIRDAKDNEVKIVVAIWPNGRIRGWNGYEDQRDPEVARLMATATNLLMGVPD